MGLPVAMTTAWCHQNTLEFDSQAKRAIRAGLSTAHCNWNINEGEHARQQGNVPDPPPFARCTRYSPAQKPKLNDEKREEYAMAESPDYEGNLPNNIEQLNPNAWSIANALAPPIDQHP